MVKEVKNEQPILKGLFCCATQSGYDVLQYLRTHSKFSEYSSEIVNLSDASCNDCDIVVCSSLQALMNIKPYLNESMVVIVCDGPLILSCIATGTPLDFVRRMSYKFEFRKIDYTEVYKSLKTNSKGVSTTPSIRMEILDYDVVGIVTENSMHGGLILSELNKVQSYFDALARNRLRHLFIELLQPGDEWKDVAVELQTFIKMECRIPAHKADAKLFWNKLFKTDTLKRLRKSIAELDKGKNINTVAKTHDISLFELNYIRKMSKNIDTAAARTEAYATRTKGIEGRI